MRIRLLRDARIQHKAGDVIEVTDPAVLANLFSSRSAEALGAEAPETPEENIPPKTTAKRTTARKK